MHTLRLIGIGLAGMLFYSALSTFLVAAPVANKLSESETPKTWLDESGAYDQLAPVVAEQLVAKEQQEGKANIGEDDLTQVLSQALPPGVLAQYGNEIIDGIYAWLHGETSRPQFHVSLAERRPEFEAAFANMIHQHLVRSPVCSSKALRDGYDPFTDSCVPKGQPIHEIADKYSGQLFARGGALRGAELSSEDIFAQMPLDQHPLQQAFALLPRISIISLIVTVVSALLVIILSNPYKLGIRTIAHGTLTASLIATAGAAFFGWLLPRMLNRTDLGSGEEAVNVSAIVKPLVSYASKDLATAVYVYSIPLLVLSLAGSIWLMRHLRTPLPPPSTV